MKFLQKMERKYGRYAIHNLSLYIIIGYVIGYIIESAAPSVYSMITLNPYLILHGQVWRIITWVIAPPSSLSIFTIIMLVFYYSIGNSLEQTWGSFRYNVYIFSGMIFTVIGAFIVYFVLQFTSLYSFAGELNTVRQYLGTLISGMFSTYYINLSIFLAFAASYPDMKVMLYFVIPVKVKWIAYLDVALIAYEFICGNWAARTAIIASLFNFLLFFFTTRNYNKISLFEVKRKRDYRKKVYKAETQYKGGAKHKCAVCGRTELDDENLVFRYCSKCNGSYEYCQDHLFTHEHKK